MVVAAAGNLDHADVVRLVRRGLRRARLDSGGHAVAGPHRSPARAGAPVRRLAVLDRTTEQAHLVLGGTGLGPLRRAPVRPRRAQQRARRRHVAGCSRRSGRSAAWRTRSTPTPRQYADAGLFGVYAGCAPGKVRRGARADPRASWPRSPRTASPTTRSPAARAWSRARSCSGLEDTGSRMSRLGKGELLYGELLTVDELLARVDAVTPDEVRAVAAEVLSRPLSLAVVGPFAESRLLRRSGLIGPASTRLGCRHDPSSGPTGSAETASAASDSPRRGIGRGARRRARRERGGADPGRRARRPRPDGHRGLPGRGRGRRPRPGGDGRRGRLAVQRRRRRRRGGGRLHPPGRGDGQHPLVHRPGHQLRRRHHRLRREQRADRSAAGSTRRPGSAWSSRPTSPSARC